jgi:hypothetical protein
MLIKPLGGKNLATGEYVTPINGERIAEMLNNVTAEPRWDT